MFVSVAEKLVWQWESCLTLGRTRYPSESTGARSHNRKITLMDWNRGVSTFLCFCELQTIHIANLRSFLFHPSSLLKGKLVHCVIILMERLQAIINILQVGLPSIFLCVWYFLLLLMYKNRQMWMALKCVHVKDGEGRGLFVHVLEVEWQNCSCLVLSLSPVFFSP